MVRDEMTNSKHPPLSELIPVIEGMEEGEILDLFGGEPTVYPHFWELTDIASNKNLRISIASNCRRMSSYEFAERLSRYGNVSIRTSLYGHNPNTHDGYTTVEGSFDETTRGIQQLCELDLSPTVNIVILPGNLRFLKQMVELLIALGVTSIKFSSLYGDHRIKDMLSDLEDVKACLHPALSIMCQRGLRLQLEKSPLCMAPLFMNYFIPESDPSMIQSSRRNYTYPGICNECRVKRACIGVLVSYIERFNDSGLTPLARVPDYAIRTLRVSDLPTYVPRLPTEFVSIVPDGEHYSPPDLLSIIRFVNEVIHKHPQTHIVENGELMYESA